MLCPRVKIDMFREFNLSWSRYNFPTTSSQTDGEQAPGISVQVQMEEQQVPSAGICRIPPPSVLEAEPRGCYYIFSDSVTLGKPALLSGPPFACWQNDSWSLQLQGSVGEGSLTVPKNSLYGEKSYSPMWEWLAWHVSSTREKPEVVKRF